MKTILKASLPVFLLLLCQTGEGVNIRDMQFSKTHQAVKGRTDIAKQLEGVLAQLNVLSEQLENTNGELNNNRLTTAIEKLKNIIKTLKNNKSKEQKGVGLKSSEIKQYISEPLKQVAVIIGGIQYFIDSDQATEIIHSFNEIADSVGKLTNNKDDAKQLSKTVDMLEQTNQIIRTNETLKAQIKKSGALDPILQSSMDTLDKVSGIRGNDDILMQAKDCQKAVNKVLKDKKDTQAKNKLKTKSSKLGTTINLALLGSVIVPFLMRNKLSNPVNSEADANHDLIDLQKAYPIENENCTIPEIYTQFTTDVIPYLKENKAIDVKLINDLSEQVTEGEGKGELTTNFVGSVDKVVDWSISNQESAVEFNEILDGFNANVYTVSNDTNDNEKINNEVTIGNQVWNTFKHIWDWYKPAEKKLPLEEEEEDDEYVPEEHTFDEVD